MSPLKVTVNSRKIELALTLLCYGGEKGNAAHPQFQALDTQVLMGFRNSAATPTQCSYTKYEIMSIIDFCLVFGGVHYPICIVKLGMLVLTSKSGVPEMTYCRTIIYRQEE